MSELTYEQMKMLFENLQDRLDRTAGDKLSHDELERIRDILDKTQKTIAKNQASGNAPDAKAIVNEFFNQWRSQAPLRELTQATRESARAGRNNVPTSGPGNTFIERQLRERAAAESRASGAIDKSTRDRVKADEKLKKSWDNFNTGIASASQRLGGFVKDLQKGALGGLAGGALGEVFSALDDRVAAYRTMIDSGEGQFTSIQQMTNAVNDAQMTVQELAKAMESSRSARQLGGANYTSLIGNLTKSTNKIGNMGLNFEQRQEATQAYLEIAARQGQLRNLSENEMVAGIKSLVKSSEETANILGISATEARKARMEQAANVNIETILAARGGSQENQDSVRETGTILREAFSDKRIERLFNQLYGTGAAGADTAALAATDPELLKILRQAADTARSGGVINQQDLSAALQAYGKQSFGSGLNQLKAQQRLLGVGNDAFDASINASAEASRLGSGRVNEKLGDDGTKAALEVESSLRAAATVFREGFDTLINTNLTAYGAQIKKLVEDIGEMSEKMRLWIRSWQGIPEITSKIGLGLFGLIGAITAFGAGLTIVNGILKIIGGAASLLAAPFKMLGNRGGNAAGGGAGAGAGAPRGAADIINAQRNNRGGNAAPNSGRSFIQRQMDRLRGATPGSGAGASGGLMGRLGGVAGASKMFKGNALIGGLFEGLDYLTGEKSLSMKNVAKSALRVGGGAIGGTAGSLLGPIGTFAGGMGGYKLGDMLANSLFGEDDRPASAVGAQGKQAPLSKPQGQQGQRPSADATGQRGRQALTADQMSNRIMNAQEAAVGHLKAMREHSETLNNLMREEINVIRSFGERQIRLLEDTSKNTRMIADNSV